MIFSFSDASSSLELNGLLKNVQKGKKQFLTAIGYTSPKGTQMALTRVSKKPFSKYAACSRID